MSEIRYSVEEDGDGLVMNIVVRHSNITRNIAPKSLIETTWQ